MIDRRVGAVLVAAFVVTSSLLRAAEPAIAGTCTNSSYHEYSVVCLYSTYKYQGTLAKWSAAVPLNISQSAAASGEFIAEALWFSDYFNNTWLEIGDTAGGAAIQGHTDEWARMRYYTDGSHGVAYELDYFYDYAPTDGQQHQYAIQWAGNGWQVCFDNSCPTSFSWEVPSGIPEIDASGGLETTANLDPAQENSGTFQLNTMNLANEVGLWYGWPSASTEVDLPCGTVPCLQGWWAAGPPPPYDMWNNGEPPY